MDNRELLVEGSLKIAEGLRKGVLKSEKTEVSFMEAPSSFSKLFGENDAKKGKLIVRV